MTLATLPVYRYFFINDENIFFLRLMGKFCDEQVNAFKGKSKVVRVGEIGKVMSSTEFGGC